MHNTLAQKRQKLQHGMQQSTFSVLQTSLLLPLPQVPVSPWLF
jgi:hypothetical protein